MTSLLSDFNTMLLSLPKTHHFSLSSCMFISIPSFQLQHEVRIFSIKKAIKESSLNRESTFMAFVL